MQYRFYLLKNGHLNFVYFEAYVVLIGLSTEAKAKFRGETTMHMYCCPLGSRRAGFWNCHRERKLLFDAIL